MHCIYLWSSCVLILSFKQFVLVYIVVLFTTKHMIDASKVVDYVLPQDILLLYGLLGLVVLRSLRTHYVLALSDCWDI